MKTITLKESLVADGTIITFSENYNNDSEITIQFINVKNKNYLFNVQEHLNELLEKHHITSGSFTHRNGTSIVDRVSITATRPTPEIVKIKGLNHIILTNDLTIKITIEGIKDFNKFNKFIVSLIDMFKKYSIMEDEDMENSEKKLYLAGSLFSESEIAQRLKEGKAIRDLNEYDVYNPIEAPCNDKAKLPTDQDIFLGDTREVLKSDVIVADLSNNDVGVMAELAISWTINHIHKLAAEGKSLDKILEENPKKKVIAHLSDIRKGTANKYKGNYIPWGFNQYIVGMIENDGQIKENFAEVIEELKEEK